MIIVETIGGEVIPATKLAESEWEFIEKYLPDYSSNNDVMLSNDCSVVLEVFGDHCTITEYLSTPENERDYSNAPFENVADHLNVDVKALDEKEVYRLQCQIDGDLFDKAVKAYNEIKSL